MILELIRSCKPFKLDSSFKMIVKNNYKIFKTN